MQFLGDFISKYYFYAVGGGVVIVIILAIIAIKIRLKNSKPGNNNFSSAILELIIGNNPEILIQMVDEKNKRKAKILEEIKKFSKINEFKKVNNSTVEISVDMDGENHWYRAKITSDNDKPKITSLTKIK